MTETIASPFHRGEQAIQTRVGARDKVEEIGRRFIRGHLPEEHRAFYGQLPFMLLGSVDETGRPWASILAGPPGFVRTPDEHTLEIGAAPLPGDPAGDYLTENAAVGLLGIEFASRRRNRVNGRVTRRDDGGLRIAVHQTFGNCPMYIQAREFETVSSTDPAVPRQALEGLDEDAREHIGRADSFFIATHYAEGDGGATDGADVSHRGGRPGFVRVAEDGSLLWPDFTGNTHFNTLGNILLNPRAGLLFVDYESGDVLTLTGAAEIVWEGDELEFFTGAERLVRFRPETGYRLPGAVGLRWRFRDYSPVLDQTGTWEEVDAAIAARAAGNTLHDYCVTRVVDESSNVRSVYLEPVNGEPPPAHVAGQFLPLELHPPGSAAPIRRTYTISNAPDGRQLRLSIKRELAPAPELPPGISSNYFHDDVAPGTKLRALDPRGTFHLDAESCRPVVLLSAGVGITPMIAMLEQLVSDESHCGPGRAIWFIHGARNGEEHAFADHVRALTARAHGVTTHIAYSAPAENDVPGRTYDHAGRVDVGLLKSLLPFDDYDFYVCGPTAFMTAIYEDLRSLNVAADRIHYEFFGPAAKLGETAVDSGAIPADAPSEPVPVHFVDAGIETTWDRSRGTLLDLAEAEGLAPPYSCRSGICQTCATPVDGDVIYAEAPMTAPPEGQALICCAYPRADESGDALEIRL